ncbi:MAG TPA: hypothetical protein VKY37_00065, partial [Brumimicrobium sp.]|nr:hypothetical protein [Brumimicrobium sp.]
KITPLYNVKLVNADGQIISEMITPNEQNITIDEIDKSQYYRFIFKDRSPQDNKLKLLSKYGEFVTLNYKSRGVYEYNPSKDYGFQPKPINVDGKLQANGKAISEKKIDLISGNADLLYTIITGKDGSFSFETLNPIKTYTIKVHEENPPIQGYNFNLVNDRGEKLVIDKIDNKTYRFQPTPSAEKYVKSEVILKDENRDIIRKTQTDSTGSFQLTGLDISKEYLLVFEEEFPNEPHITITNGKGEEIRFVKTSKNEFRYTPSEDVLEQLARGSESSITGKVKSEDQLLSNVEIVLKDKEGKLLQQSTTDANGQFRFSKVDKSKIHQIQLGEDVDGTSKPINVELYDNDKNKLLYVKKNNKTFEYYPIEKSSPLAKGSSRVIEGVLSSESGNTDNLQVNLLNVNRSKVFIAKSDSLGKINFSNVDLSDQHFLQFDENLPEDAVLNISNNELGDIELEKVENGLYKIKPIYNAKLINQDHQIIAESVSNKMDDFQVEHLDRTENYQLVFKDTAPRDEEIKVYAQNGDQLTFKTSGKGVYGYEKTNNYNFTPNSVGVSGRIISNGQAVSNTQVRLLSSESKLLLTALTGDDGSFDFTKLDPTETYTIVVVGDNPEMMDYNIQLKNTKGEQLSVNKVDDSTYDFDPIIDSDNLKNSKVVLKDGMKNVISSTTTNSNGSFQLDKLDPDKEYHLVFENKFPAGTELTILSEDGNALQFIKTDENTYKYTPKKDATTQFAENSSSKINASVSSTTGNVDELEVKLLDKNRKVLETTKTNGSGEIDFKEIDLSDEHYLHFNGLPEDAKVALSNDDLGNLELQKIGDGLYKVKAVYSVKLIHKNNTIISELITNNDNDYTQVDQ